MTTLPAERAGHPASDDLNRRRGLFGPTEPDPALGVQVDARTYAGVPVREVSAGADVTVVYLHGGGFRMGSPEAYLAWAAQLAAGASARVVVPHYRLAPEHPFPSGLIDCLAVYRHVASTTEGPLVVAGDSAGAGLAASVVAIARAEGVRAPAGLLLLSPWLDLRCESGAHQTSSDPYFTYQTAIAAADDYLQGAAATHPLASPLLGDLTGFPPTLVHVGTGETLTDDALALASGLGAAGVNCTLELVAGQGHTWPLVEPSHPDSHRTAAAFARFLRECGARSGR